MTRGPGFPSSTPGCTSPSGCVPAYFEWEPTSVEQGRTVGNASRWQMAVVQPARDMGAALLLVMGAARRLASGLLGYSEFVVAGRGRVLPGLESNQP